MKRLLAVLAVVVMTAGTAMAMGPMGGGPGGCGCMGAGPDGKMTAAQKKFIADTMTLRQEMMNKHFDIQKEFIKDKPDAAVISKLKGEINELRARIMDARAKAGLPMGYKGYKMMKGGMGSGMMMDCPMMADPPAQPATK